MARRRYAPIKSDKHEITWSFLGLDASGVTNVQISLGVDSADKDAATECEIGSHVYGVYLEFQFSAANTANVNVLHWNVTYIPTGAPAPAIPSLYYQTQRSNVLKRGMEMIPANVATVIKRIVFVAIPRKAQRVADGSQLNFAFIASTANTINACGIGIYKEIY